MGIPSWGQAMRVAAAARLRAAGNDWEAVARILGCHPRTCQRWPTKYSGWWARYTQRASEDRLRGVWAELERVWRNDLRSANARRRHRAARRIVRSARRSPWAISATAKAEAERVLAAEALPVVSLRSTTG
jgi:hypothetical protein